MNIQIQSKYIKLDEKTSHITNTSGISRNILLCISYNVVHKDRADMVMAVCMYGQIELHYEQKYCTVIME